MTQTQLQNETFLERGYTVFKDAKGNNDSVVVGSYRILKAILPSNLIKPKCAFIFGLQCARTQLSSKQEQIIQYYYYMSLPYAEIARRTGLSVYRVQKLKEAAIGQLNKFTHVFLA